MTHTSCIYCGEAGQVVPLKHTPGTDLHAHNCGTTMLITHDTGEIQATRRHYWCARYDALKAEMHALSTQVHDLIHQRDGDPADDTDIPF